MVRTGASMRRVRAVLLALAAPALAAEASLLLEGADGGEKIALAQTKRASPARQQPRGNAPAVTPQKKPVADAGGGGGAIAPVALAPAAPAPGPTVSPPSSPGVDAGVVETKTLDGGTHVFKFSELDIEGRLKSPQLVYFLRRVRAEFAAGELGHRTFMREMSETRKERTF
jgi:hypothetical protein